MQDNKTALLGEMLSDPHGVFARLRSHGPIANTEMGPMAVTYDAVRKMMQDSRLAANIPAVLVRYGISSGPFFDFMSASPLNREGEDHRRWRLLMTKTFTPSSVDRLRPYLRAEAQRLVEQFADSGSCEFVEAFARQLPSLGLCELVGVPKEDRSMFGEWADVIGLGFNPMLVASRIDDINTAIRALLDYARDLVRKRIQTPQDDLVSRLAQAASEDPGCFDESIMTTTVAAIVFAGHETTKNQLGFMIVALSQSPDEWDRVAAQAERAQPLVEELLRLQSAVTHIGRTATEDLSLNDVVIPAGSRVLASIWSANRDSAAFATPNAIDIDRNLHSPQIAFGQGAHHCLGAALARAELQEALRVLSVGITCPSIEPGAEFLPAAGITGATRLPIRFTKRNLAG